MKEFLSEYIAISITVALLVFVVVLLIIYNIEVSTEFSNGEVIDKMVREDTRSTGSVTTIGTNGHFGVGTVTTGKRGGQFFIIRFEDGTVEKIEANLADFYTFKLEDKVVVKRSVNTFGKVFYQEVWSYQK